MKKFSTFNLSEVDIGIYSDEIRLHVSSFVDSLWYSMTLIYDPKPSNSDSNNICAEFGDQNWGTHYGIIHSVVADDESFQVRFKGNEGPVPWLTTCVTYDWSRIREGKQLIFETLRTLCAYDDIPCEVPTP